jgi:hypothetical protein
LNSGKYTSQTHRSTTVWSTLNSLVPKSLTTNVFPLTCDTRTTCSLTRSLGRIQGAPGIGKSDHWVGLGSMGKYTRHSHAAEAEVKPSEQRDKRPQSYATSQARRGVVGWLERSDKRGPVARRFRDLVGLVMSDLASDPTELSESQRQIVRRIASLSVWCESQEAKMADGAEINILEFGRTANSLRRLCESIGLRRVARDVTPTLGDILREGHRRDREVAEAADAEVEDVE